ncbi:MAG: GC-type dockerin domain-anchored protein [Phycisphaerales bacterium]
MSTTFRNTTTILALAAAAGSALAGGGECEVFRAYMPDFDQRRAPAFDLQGNLVVPGLPGLGQAYCVPTSAINRMAYISNRGYPNMLDGPRDYQSALIYDDMTDAIEDMGNIMNTHPVTGTTGANWLAGTKAWLNARYPGHFVVTQYGAKNQYAPSPDELGKVSELGAIVDICYGRYELQVGGGLNLWRTSGHACTLRSASNYCGGPGFPSLGLRNPYNNTPLYTQATFATATSTMDTVTASWANLGQASGTSRTMWRFRDFDDNILPWRMLDGYNAIWPIYGLSLDSMGPGNIVIAHHPAELAGSQTPPVGAHTLAGVAQISALSLSPDALRYFVRDRTTGTQSPRLLSINRATSAPTPVATLTSTAGPMTCTRDGDLFVVDGPMIRKFRTTGGPITQVGAISLTGTVVAMGCTLADDSFVDGRIITAESSASGPGRLKVYNANTLALIQDTVLPTSVSLAGSVSIACSPFDARFYICSSTIGQVCEFVAPPAVPFAIATCFTLGTGVQPYSLQVTDTGSMIYVDRGILRERTRVAGGLLVTVPGSLFDGTPSGNTFRLAVSATNWDPAIMTPRSFTWNPEGETPGEDDCVADINNDGGVDGDDVIRFFELWDANQIDADVNQDGGIDGDDVIVFFERWDAGC